MLVIHECIDCGVCEPECPVDAIKPDTEPGFEKWLDINAKYSQTWPNITVKGEPPPDAKNILAQVIESWTAHIHLRAKSHINPPAWRQVRAKQR
jgi:ferredoxin